MLRSQKCPSIMPLIAVNETWNGSSGRSSFKRGLCLQWCAYNVCLQCVPSMMCLQSVPTMCAFNDARPIFNDRIQTGHENWGTGAVLRKMGVTPDSGLASLWLLLLFSEQCSPIEQHLIVLQWNLFTHTTGFDYYCCCSQTEEHPSALDHLGRTWVSCAIFHIFSKPSLWLSGPNSSRHSQIPLLPQYSLHLLQCHCISLILYQWILGAGISIIM